METTPSTTPEAFTRKVYFVLKVGLLTAAVLFLLSHASYIFLLGFAAALLALFFTGLAELIQRVIRLPLGWSLALGIALILLVGGGIVVASAPSIVRQTETLVEVLPRSLDQLTESVRRWPRGEELITTIEGSLDPKNLTIGGREVLTRATSVASAVGNTLVNVLVIVLTAVYLTIAPKAYKGDIVRLFPPHHRAQAAEVMHRLAVSLQWWILGRLFSMAVIGVFTMIGLLILGVPLAFLLGFFAALVSFIPNLGPIISAIPAILLGFSQSPATALYVVVLYAAIQLVESYFLTPFVEKRTVSIRPAFLLIVQIFFGIYFGLFGLILSSALVAVAIVLIKALYIEPIENQEVKA